MTDTTDEELRIKLLQLTDSTIRAAIQQLRRSQEYKTPQIEETGYYATKQISWSHAVDKLEAVVTVQFRRPVVIDEVATLRMLTEEEL